ncbi:MAG: T9SS type A sorting domain-containing protein [Bacteroidota bacterium]
MKKIFYLIMHMLPLSALAQCYQDRHNTSWNEGWISCEERLSPNAERGNGHWIMYDFGHTYRLGEAKFWNINSPEFLESGIKDFYIDFSQDGFNWSSLGQFSLSQGPGESLYEGEEITSFGGDTARFVLITAIDTYGGACAGFAEAKIDVIEVVSEIQIYQRGECFEASVYPNPHVDVFTFSINTFCTGRIDYSLYDHTGKLIRSEAFASDDALKLKEIYTTDLPAGLYHLVVTQKDEIQRYPVIKLK